MKILAVDTASKTASVCLAESDGKSVKLIAEHTAVPRSHAQSLLGMIRSVIETSDNTPEDVDVYAAVTGPGSFTGIRIGVSTIKGFALADGKPCVGVSSLEALALSCRGISGIIVPALDSRRDTYYTAMFYSDGSGNVERLSEDAQLTSDELLGALREKLGDGGAAYMPGDALNALGKRAAEYGITLNGDAAYPHSAYGAACAAVKLLANGDAQRYTAAEMNPVYLKKCQAERERDERIAAETTGKI